MNGKSDGVSIRSVNSRRSARRLGAALIVSYLATAPVVAYSQEQPATLEVPHWSYLVVFDYYVLSEGSDYLQPTIKADHGNLHLEARYNYEDFSTASLLFGRNFVWDGSVEFEIVPMLGAVFGNTEGLAPAFSLRLAWNRIELYNESQYVFDLEDDDYNFLFAWTEVVVWPARWFRVGLADQRTHLNTGDADAAPGLVAGLHFGRAGGSLYVFDPGHDYRYAILGFEIDF